MPRDCTCIDDILLWNQCMCLKPLTNPSLSGLTTTLCFYSALNCHSISTLLSPSSFWKLGVMLDLSLSLSSCNILNVRVSPQMYPTALFSSRVIFAENTDAQSYSDKTQLLQFYGLSDCFLLRITRLQNCVLDPLTRASHLLFIVCNGFLYLGISTVLHLIISSGTCMFFPFFL